jgi:hypothetical protein
MQDLKFSLYDKFLHQTAFVGVFLCSLLVLKDYPLESRQGLYTFPPFI